MGTRMLRRGAAVAVGTLTVTTLGAVGTGSSAGAAEGCLSEQRNPPIFGTACDDSVPPTTTASISPAVNGAGYLRDRRPVVTFSGAHTDADTDQIAFQCQLYQGTTPSQWQSCTSPWRPAEDAPLAESKGNPWTFRVRAVDGPDNGINLVSPIFGGTDVPDYDDSPETFTFQLDSRAPQESNIVGFPRDPANPVWPILRQPRVSMTLEVTQDDGSPVGAACSVDDEPVLCDPGEFTLTGLGPGDHVFKLAATDAAGNREAYPARKTFTVPRNLKSRRGWTRVDAAESFAGDYLQTRRVGAELRVPAKDVREVKLIAPRGPGQGRVEVLVGSRVLRSLNLGAGSASPFQVYTVQAPGSPRLNRPLTIRVVRVPKGGHVRLDAVVTR